MSNKMPVRKFYGKRKGVRRSPYKKSSYKTKKSLAPLTHNFSRFCNDSVLKNKGIGDVIWDSASTGNWELGLISPDDNGLYQFGGAMRFQLSDIIDPLDFTSLFDRYKLNMVKVTMMPLMNQAYGAISTTGNVQTSTLPTLLTSIDYDDGIAPSDSLDLLERQNCRSYRFDKPVTVTIKNPKMLLAVQQGDSVFTQVAAATTSGKYLDCADQNVNHYGFKFYIRDMLLPDYEKAQNLLVRIRVKYYLSFKEPK